MSANIATATVRKVQEQLFRSGLATATDLLGCSEEEVRSVELRCGGTLPNVYRGFLLAMGRKAGRFYEGTDLFYPRLLELRVWAEELLSEGGAQFSLPRDAFVFLMHQGYQFMYFLLGASENDPPVFRYCEGNGTACEYSPSFSAFLMQSARDYGHSVHGQICP